MTTRNITKSATTAIVFLITVLATASIGWASDKAEKEKKLAQSINELSIPSGIVDVYKDTNGQITVYIGGRGSATANLVKISRVKAEDHALRVADAETSRAFAEFIKKNVDAVLNVVETITDSSLDVEDLVKKMKDVTENKTLAGQLLPEDRAQIIKAVIERTIDSIRHASGVQSVSSLEVRQHATETIRGMNLFGSHVDAKGQEVVAVKVFKWSPESATFAAKAAGYNNQKPTMPEKGAEALMQKPKKNQPFISGADDF